MISVDDLSVHLKIGKLPAWQRALIVGLAEIDVHKRAAELAALSHHAQIHSATMSRCHQFQAADAVRVAEFQPEIVSYSAFKPFFCFHSRSARTVQLAFVEPMQISLVNCRRTTVGFTKPSSTATPALCLGGRVGPRFGPGGTRSLQPDFRRSAVPIKVTWHAINGAEVIVVDGPRVDVRSRDQLSD